MRRMLLHPSTGTTKWASFKTAASLQMLYACQAQSSVITVLKARDLCFPHLLKGFHSEPFSSDCSFLNWSPEGVNLIGGERSQLQRRIKVNFQSPTLRKRGPSRGKKFYKHNLKMLGNQKTRPMPTHIYHCQNFSLFFNLSLVVKLSQYALHITTELTTQTEFSRYAIWDRPDPEPERFLKPI